MAGGDEVPQRLIRHQTFTLRVFMLIFAGMGLIVAGIIVYGVQTEVAEAESNCAVNTYYATPEECLAVQLGDNSQWYTLAGAAGGAGALLIMLAFWLRDRTPGFLKVLRTRSKEVSHVFIEERRMRGTPKGTDGELSVVARLKSGGEYHFDVPNRTDANAVLRAAGNLAPAASKKPPKRS